MNISKVLGTLAALITLRSVVRATGGKIVGEEEAVSCC